MKIKIRIAITTLLMLSFIAFAQDDAQEQQNDIVAETEAVTENVTEAVTETVTETVEETATATATDTSTETETETTTAPDEVRGFEVIQNPVTAPQPEHAIEPDADPASAQLQETATPVDNYSPFDDAAPTTDATYSPFEDAATETATDAATETEDEPNIFVTEDGLQIRIGVLPLSSATGHDRLALEMTRELLNWLEETGIYETYDPDIIDRTLRDSRARVESGCNSERCAYDIGRSLEFGRMILGSVDETETRVGVRLKLLDVATRKPIQTVSVEGAAGVGAKEVLIAALNRLHGGKTNLELTPYRGPSENNMREFLFSTAAVQGAGLLYTAINYLAGSTSNSNGQSIVFAPDGPYTGGGTLSGISGSSNQIPIFARPAALANAYTAVSDDAYGVLYNPAGMAWVTRRDAVFAYQYRFGMDIFAFSYANMANRNVGFGQAVFLATDRDGAMTEMFFTTALGYRFNNDVIFGPMSVGASVKTAGASVRALSPDSPKGQSYGAGLDLGIMWELSDNIRYGILLRDFPTVNNWANRTTDVTYSEMQPPTLHMGGSYRASYSTFLTADGQIPLYADQPWVMAGGIEYEFFRMLAIRVGMQREILNEAANWWKITSGAGIKIDTRSQWGQNMEFDFAYEYNTLRLFPVFNMSVKVGF